MHVTMIELAEKKNKNNYITDACLKDTPAES